MYACHACGAEIAEPRSVYRNTTCSRCGKDLHSCRNCRFYSPGAHYDCAETVDEEVTDKERGNFCSFFALKDRAGPGKAGGPSGSGASEARRKLDELFGNG
jgi:hypothetical protein